MISLSLPIWSFSYYATDFVPLQTELYILVKVIGRRVSSCIINSRAADDV